MKIKNTFTLALATALLGAISGASVAASGGGVVANPGAAEGKHFHPKGKMPSKYTIELRKGISATLPFEDKLRCLALKFNSKTIINYYQGFIA
jgi:hypothetical protein